MVYENETIAANLIVRKWEEFQNNNLKIKILNLIGMLQAGKTGTVKIALRLISYLWDKQTNSQEFGITVLTTYSLTDLNNQVERDYGDMDDIVDTVRIGKIDNAIKKDYLGKNKKVLDSIKGGIVVIDEAEYGVGNEGRVQRLIDYLLKSQHSYFIILVGATNYSLQDSEETKNGRFQVSNVVIEPGEGYRGIKEFLESDKFINLDGKSHKFNGPLPKFVLKALDWEIKNNENGIYFLRANQTKYADDWKTQLEKLYDKPEYNAEVSSVHSDNGGAIAPRIKNALRNGKTRNQIIIAVGSLSAGFTTHPNTKKYFRFGFEHNPSSKAGAVQGFPGRMCDYNPVYMPTIIASKAAFEEYLKYHRCIREGKPFYPKGKASTQLKGKVNIEEHADCKLVEEFDISDEKSIHEKYSLEHGKKGNFVNRNEKVKTTGARNLFDRAVAETKKDTPNYYWITHKAEFGNSGGVRIMQDYTILKFEDGRCQLWKRVGETYCDLVNVSNNKSLFAKVARA
jgi:hypothetical protein